MGREVQE